MEIVRPSIISASWAFPKIGWIDSLAAFAGIVALTAVGRHKVFRGLKEAPLDLVPVDFVAECVLQKTFQLRSGVHITHATMGLDDSLSVEQAHEGVIEFFRRLPVSGQYAGNAYIGVHPWKSRAWELWKHELPLRLSSLGLQLLRRSNKKIKFVRKKQKFINSRFTYFVTRRFNFQRDEPLKEVCGVKEFSAQRYLELICEGIYQHIFKLDKQIAPLLTPRLSSPGLGLRRSLFSREGHHFHVRLMGQVLKWLGRKTHCQLSYDYEAIRRSLDPGNGPKETGLGIHSSKLY